LVQRNENLKGENASVKKFVWQNLSMKSEIEISECASVEELTECVALQREVFALPEIEISPVRHLIVTRQAGGFTLGAFAAGKLAGFVLSVAAFVGNEKFFYSHMTAVKKDFQSSGIGARLKWAQRARALERASITSNGLFSRCRRATRFLIWKNSARLSAATSRIFTAPIIRPRKTRRNRSDSTATACSPNGIWTAKKSNGWRGAKSFLKRTEAWRKIAIPNDWNWLVKNTRK
jgi:hypothetical protein